MHTVKKDAMDAIANLPESVDMNEIMYRLYVLDKIRKGQEAVDRGETITHAELGREIESW